MVGMFSDYLRRQPVDGEKARGRVAGRGLPAPSIGGDNCASPDARPMGHGDYDCCHLYSAELDLPLARIFCDDRCYDHLHIPIHFVDRRRIASLAAL